jgi:cell fate regulator YaaT (PSP1 superfamily)
MLLSSLPVNGPCALGLRKMACGNCGVGPDGKPAGCKNNGFCSSSGCNKLDVFDWLAGVPLPSGQTPFDAVEVRFKNTRKAFYRNANALQLMPGDLVTVDAAPGHDVGMVSLTGELVKAQMQRRSSVTDSYELRKILRKSTQDDIDRWHASRKLEDETMYAARKITQEMRLEMKVSDVEYQGDGTKATFYYTSEQRIDFRDLLRKLADRFKVRIDLKQIGARQEAGRIGGIGSCGRELCCSTWLTDFRSVTTSAARYQQLALNPQKLAGQCGKLKCCLNYELDMYIEAIKSYPSQNAKLKTLQGTGVHMKTDIFEEKMWYLFKRPGEAPVMAGLSIERVREILAQNKEGIEVEVDFARLAEENEAEKNAGVEEEPEYESVGGEDELTRFDSKIKGGKRKRGGRDRKKGGGGGQPPRGGGGQPQRSGEQRPQQPKSNAPARPRSQGQDGGEAPRGDQAPREGRKHHGRRRGGRGNRPDNRPPGDGGAKPPAA